MPQIPPQRLRVDNDTVKRHLDRLDERAGRPRGIDLRVSERYRYRIGQTTLTLAQGDDQVVSQAAAPRNLSREGIGLLTGRFVYPGTPCRVGLRSLYGQDDASRGRVVRCRYLVGSPSLHEVGIRFNRPIDVELFAADAMLVRILLVDESPAMQRLLAGFLEGMNAELTFTTTALDAASAALTQEFDLILLDLESPDTDAFTVTRELRRAGYLGPMVGLAVQTGRTLRARCEEAGCTGYLAKPITRDALRTLVGSLRDEPVLSTLARDVTMAPLIDQFVRGLRGRARKLAIAVEQGNREQVRDVALRLRGDAGSYGFDAISEEAEHVQALAALDVPLPRLRSAVYELIHLCLAARPATSSEETGLSGNDLPTIGPKDWRRI